MKDNKPKVDFFEVLENIVMYAGFICMISVIIINLFR